MIVKCGGCGKTETREPLTDHWILSGSCPECNKVLFRVVENGLLGLQAAQSGSLLDEDLRKKGFTTEQITRMKVHNQAPMPLPYFGYPGPAQAGIATDDLRKKGFTPEQITGMKAHMPGETVEKYLPYSEYAPLGRGTGSQSDAALRKKGFTPEQIGKMKSPVPDAAISADYGGYAG